MKNFVISVFVLFCLAFLVLPACSPETQKVAQKVVFANTVKFGFSLVKPHFPDTEIMLAYDSLTRSYRGVGKLSHVEVFLAPGNTLLLKRQIDWAKTNDIITSKGFELIDKGLVVIKFKRTPRDSLSQVVR